MTSREGGPERAPARALRVLPAMVVAVLAVAGALLVPALAATELDDAARVPAVGDPAWWCAVAVPAAQAGALLWIGRAPRAVVVAIAALPALLVLAAPGALFSLTVLATIVATFLVTVARPDRRTAAALGTAFALVAACQLANELRMAELSAGIALGAALLQAALVVGAPTLVGLMVAARRETQRARLGEKAALERERETLVRAAAARERTAMSRELHDIAAHHMSGIALMASAIDRQIDTDPAAAKRSAAQIRQQSRSVLEDLRRVVGLLREGDDDGRSVKTVSAVRELVDARRQAGADLELVVYPAGDGRAPGDGIGALAQLVVYRMVQEALANAATHAAGAHSVVEIDDRGDRLVVTVANDRPDSVASGWVSPGRVASGQSSSGQASPGQEPSTRGGGFGLLGMRERAEMVGSDLAYGSTDDGGWRVRLAVPRVGGAGGAVPGEGTPS